MPIHERNNVGAMGENNVKFTMKYNSQRIY
jgi:hypothetical protein